MWQSTWALRLGLLSVLLLPLSPLGVKLGLWTFTIGFLLLGMAILIGLVTVILVLLFIFRDAQKSHRSHLTVAALLGLSPLAVIAMVMLSTGPKPAIHDISTDWNAPPQFQVLLAQRGTSSNPLKRDEQVIALQQEHYPDVQTILTAIAPYKARSLAVKTAESLGWKIENISPTGLIEATYTSALYGFIDDVVIRIEVAANGGSKIDLRSVSRIGRGDLGANAARIMAFTEVFNQEAGSE